MVSRNVAMNPQKIKSYEQNFGYSFPLNMAKYNIFEKELSF